MTPDPTVIPGFFERVRRRAGGLALEAALNGLSGGAALHPAARRALAQVDRLRDVPYRTGGDSAHLLDVWRPRGLYGPRPAVLYLHGGAFRILSKDTHWSLVLPFVRRGYAVFCANYRLAPRHRFPAAVEDAAHALQWVWRNAELYGADPQRLVIAGESAGANLAVSVALTTAYARPEPWARAVFDLGVAPTAVVPLCGVLQVSDADRFARRKRLPTWLRDRLVEVEHCYLGPEPHAECGLDLADPLCLLERGLAPDRPLPPFLTSVGTRDPLLDDTRRLQAALERLGVPCYARFVEGEPHAFQALLHRPAARQSWRDLFDALDPLAAL